MQPFAGSQAQTALQVVAGDAPDAQPTSVQVRSTLAVHGVGWYRVRFFAMASPSFDGVEDPVELQVVGASGALMWLMPLT